LKLYFIGNPEH